MKSQESVPREIQPRKAFLPAAVLAVMVLSLLLALAWFSQRQANARLAAELQAVKTSLAASRDALDASLNLSQQMQEKMGHLAEVLEQSTEKLSLANARLKSYERSGPPPSAAPPAPTPEQNQAAARARAEIPAPTIAETEDKAGRLVRNYTFSILPDQAGQPLAVEVEFSSLSGRRLVFRRETGGPLGFDVDEVHPGVLAWLQIDPAAAKYQQTEMERQKKEREAAAHKDMLARQAFEQKKFQAAQAAKLEQARQEEALRLAKTEEEMKYHQLETERLKAAAAMHSAEAAMVRARNTIPVYVGATFTLPVPGTAPTAPVAPAPPTAPVQPTDPLAPGAGAGSGFRFLPGAPILPAPKMLPAPQPSNP